VPDYLTIPDVELCSVGMKWPSAAGEITMTFEHLADAVAASNDVHIRPPRLKLGHSDERFNADRRIDHDPFYTGDAEPAVGSVANLRLVDNGAVLMGDYVEVPVWLAAALPSAYPSRSVEGGYTILERNSEPIGSWKVTTPGGREYSFVLTACALLGTVPPAIADLEDLRRFLVEGRGAVVAGRDPAELGGVAASGSMETVPDGPAPASLEADVDQVIVAFCEEYCIGDRYQWWPRAFRVDPNRIIADDEAGGLWAVQATTDDAQNVSFGEPEQVLQVFVPADAARATFASLSASADLDGRVVARFASRDDLPDAVPDHVREGGVEDSGNTSGMDFTKEQRATLIAKHSLAADATDEQITAAVLAAPAGDGDGEGGGEGSGSGNGDGGNAGGEGTGTEGAEGGEGAAGSEGGEGDGEGAGAGGEGGGAEASGAETVTVDKGVLTALKASADRGVAADEARLKVDRDARLDKAVELGKFMPASRAAWEKKLIATPAEAAAEIDALEENLIPVSQRGHGGGQTPAEATAAHAPTRDEMVGLFGAAYAPPAQEG
jgi:hypothetical protein